MPVLLLTSRGWLLPPDESERYLVYQLPKPFALSILEQRIDAMLTEVQRQRYFALEGNWVDLKAQTVFRNGKKVPLSPAEFDALSKLIRQPGQALSGSQLVGGAWVEGSDVVLQLAALLMERLQDKLDCRAIVRSGDGYRLIGPMGGKSVDFSGKFILYKNPFL